MVSFAPRPATAAGSIGVHLDGCLDRFAAPASGFNLVYDESGLVLDYPGIAVRAPF